MGGCDGGGSDEGTGGLGRWVNIIDGATWSWIEIDGANFRAIGWPLQKLFLDGWTWAMGERVKAIMASVTDMLASIGERMPAVAQVTASVGGVTVTVQPKPPPPSGCPTCGK